MGFSEIVIICIVICIVCILLALSRVLAYPLNIGIPSLPPVPLTSSIWNIFLNVLLIATVIIVTAFFVLYCVYKIIEMVIKPIPIFGTIIWAIVEAMTPFKELKAAGIFDLFDALVGIVGGGFSRDSFRAFAAELVRFYGKSLGYVRQYTSKYMPNAKVGLPGEGGGAANFGGGVSSSKSKAKPAPAQDESIAVTQSQSMQLRDEYIRCMRENTVTINPKDSVAKQRLGDSKNQLARSQCQSKNAGLYMKFIMMQKQMSMDFKVQKMQNEIDDLKNK